MNIYNNLIQANLANDDGGRLALPDGRELPDQRLQQHHRQQRVDARRWRCRPRRRPERAVLQQHGDEEPDDGDRCHQQRSAGACRSVDRGQQHPAAGDACHGWAQPACSATRCCSTTSSGTTVPARRVRPRSPGSVYRATRPRSSTGTWDRSTAAGLLHADQLGAANPDAGIPIVRCATNQRRSPIRMSSAPYDTVVAFDAWRTNPAFIGAIMVSVDLDPNLLGDYHLSGPASSASQPGCGVKGGAHLSAAACDPQRSDVRHRQPGSPWRLAIRHRCRRAPGAAFAVIWPSLKTDNGQTVLRRSEPRSPTRSRSSKATTGVVTNAPSADTSPASLTSVSWTCAAPPVPARAAARRVGLATINTTVTLGDSSYLDSDVHGHCHRVGLGTRGRSSNTATVTAPGGDADTTQQLVDRHRHQSSPCRHCRH